LGFHAQTLKTAALALALAAPASHAQDLAPDALVKTISTDVLAAMRDDKDIQAGNPKKSRSSSRRRSCSLRFLLITTRIAMGANWRRASPEQREQLVRESGRFWCARIPARSPTTATR